MKRKHDLEIAPHGTLALCQLRGVALRSLLKLFPRPRADRKARELAAVARARKAAK